MTIVMNICKKDIINISKGFPKKINKFIDLNSTPVFKKSFFTYNKFEKWVLNCPSKERFYVWKYIETFPDILIKNIDELERNERIYDPEVYKIMQNLKQYNDTKSLLKYGKRIKQVSKLMHDSNGVITNFPLMNCINYVEPTDLVLFDIRYMKNENKNRNIDYLTRRIEAQDGYYCIIADNDFYLDYKKYNIQSTFNDVTFLTNYY